jgi:D-glycero-D-manno-heptose 1,7-bisphosphate phosphatase
LWWVLFRLATHIDKYIIKSNLTTYFIVSKCRNIVSVVSVVGFLKVLGNNKLKVLQSLVYKLFLISNQPDYAKGKTTLENLKLVHKKMYEIFSENNINFTDYFYCYHHPQGIVKDYSVVCECRKPGNLFLRQANLQYGLDMANSWMIGDRDADIYCGQSLGLKAIMVASSEPSEKAGKSRPDYRASDLKEAVEVIKKCQTLNFY